MAVFKVLKNRKALSCCHCRHFWRFACELFLDTCRLTATLAQVVELGTADITTALDFDRSDQGAVSLERTLHAFAVRDFANDEVGVEGAVANRDHNAFKSLYTITVSPGAKGGITLPKRAISSCSRVWSKFILNNFQKLIGSCKLHKRHQVTAFNERTMRLAEEKSTAHYSNPQALSIRSPTL
jgi:hypothetical protein